MLKCPHVSLLVLIWIIYLRFATQLSYFFCYFFFWISCHISYIAGRCVKIYDTLLALFSLCYAHSTPFFLSPFRQTLLGTQFYFFEELQGVYGDDDDEREARVEEKGEEKNEISRVYPYRINFTNITCYSRRIIFKKWNDMKWTIVEKGFMLNEKYLGILFCANCECWLETGQMQSYFECEKLNELSLRVNECERGEEKLKKPNELIFCN